MANVEAVAFYGLTSGHLARTLIPYVLQVLQKKAKFELKHLWSALLSAVGTVPVVANSPVFCTALSQALFHTDTHFDAWTPIAQAAWGFAVGYLGQDVIREVLKLAVTKLR